MISSCLDDGDASPATLFPIPDRYVGPAQGFVVFVPPERFTRNAELPASFVAYDAQGTQLAEESLVATEPVLAGELGLNRYERLARFDDSAARRYRERTEPFWDEVRAAWDEIIATHDRFTLRAAPDQGQLFTPLFEYADTLFEGAPFDREAARKQARETVRGYLGGEAGTSRPGY